MIFRMILISCLLGVALFARAAPVDQESTRPLVSHMHEHYDAVNKIKTAVIAGDLEAAREPARWLAEHSTPSEVPAAWYSHVENMRAAARTVYKATSTDTAANATAAMAGSCGSCHMANNIYDQFPTQLEPADELGNIAHMVRHQWAADRMWEALVGPSDDAWDQGTELLLEVPLSSAEMHVQDDANRSIRGMARRVHELAAHGMMERDFAKRVEVYGEFLGSCAACHVRLRQGPGK